MKNFDASTRRLNQGSSNVALNSGKKDSRSRGRVKNIQAAVGLVMNVMKQANFERYREHLKSDSRLSEDLVVE